MSVRVSTRGVRTSVGTRAARVSMGSGGTRVSSGFGPFFASTSLSSGRRRSASGRRGSSRSLVPSPAQLERARRQAERAQQQTERDALIAQLNQLRQQTTSVHLQNFAPAQPPAIPVPPQPDPSRVLADARSFHLSGVGMFARTDRAAAKQRAEDDARAYLAAEQARLRSVHQNLTVEAGRWWQALTSNNEEIVCEAVNLAFSDNPAAGCAMGVDGSVLSVVIRQPDIDALPNQMPGLTPGGRPTLKTLTKRDRTLWWLTSMGSNIIATLKEGFAVAPAITAIDLAVISRLPDTHRLGFVAYGRWSRQAIETRQWRSTEDALRFLDIGHDVACSVTTTASGNTASTIKALNTSGMPGLQALLEHAQDDTASDETALADLEDDLREDSPPPGESSTDPFHFRSFTEWKEHSAPAPAPPAPAPPHAAAPIALVPGQTVPLPEQAWYGLNIGFTFAGADADLTLFLTDGSGSVASDHDFVFYGQPVAAQGAARLLGKHAEGDHITERASLQLAALPQHVQRVALAINMDVATGLTCGALTHAALRIDCATAAWAFTLPCDPGIRAMVVAELYRHTADGVSGWKARAIGQGWAEGLDGLARAHGVNVE